MYQFEPLKSEGIFDVLKTAQFCVLSVANDNQPYSVPINCQWKFEEGRLWFLISSSEEGKKMKFLQGNRKVCLQFQNIDENKVETVIANGKVFRIEKDEENPSNNDEEDPSNNVVYIEILATNVSGRAYTINNNAEEGECADVPM